MKEIVQQLPSLRELPLPEIEIEVLSTCIQKRMSAHGFVGNFDAYEQLLQLDKREIATLLCEILAHKTTELEEEKSSHTYDKEWLEVLDASLDDILLEVSREYMVINAWLGPRKAFGRNRQDLIQKTLQEIFQPDISSTLETIIDQVFQTSEGKCYEFYDSNDRNWYAVKITDLSPIESRHNHTSLLFKNITLRKEAEEALKVSEHKYKVLVENSPQAIMVHAENRFLFANQTALKLLRAKSFDDLLAINVIDIVAPEDHELVAKRIQDMYAQKRDAPLRRGRFIRLDGVSCYAEILGCRIEYEGKPASQIVFRDITQEINTQERLYAQERLLKATNEAANHFLTARNEDQGINRALKVVMEAISASRSYIFENHYSDEGDLWLSQKYDATTQELESVMDNPAFQNLSYADIGFEKERVILEKGEIVVGRKNDFSPSVMELMTIKGVSSMVVLPIFVQDKFWGLLGLSSVNEEKNWFESELAILRNFANTVGSFISNRRIEACEQIEYEVANILSLAKDSEEAIQQTIASICRKLSWDFGEFWARDQVNDHLNLQSTWFNKNNLSLKEFAQKSVSFKYNRNEGMIGRAWVSEKVLHSIDFNSKYGCPRIDIAQNAGIYSRLAIPVLIENEVLGVVYLASTKRKDLDEVFIRTFISVGGQLGQFIKRKQAEKYYRNLTETVPAVVWRLDVESFSFAYISSQIETLLGFSKENWIGNSSFWESRIHPEDRSYAVNYCKNETAKMLNHEFEYRMIHKDGSVVWISDHVHVLEKNGKPVELVGLFIDVTEQKQAEKALEISEERLKLAIDGVELGLWDWNIKEDTAYSNKVMKDMLGYNNKEVPKHFSDAFKWIHPDDIGRVEQMLSSHLAGETSVYQDEFRIKTKSGIWKWFLDIGKVIERDKSGKPLRMLGIHRDIDERKRAEESLRISEERLRLALKGIGICDWNIEKDQIYINDAWMTFLGYGLGSISTSEDYFKLLHPQDLKAVTSNIQTHFSGGMSTFRTEFRIRKKDESYVWVLTQGEIVEWDTKGNPIRMISTHLDISEIKEYQQKIQELNKDLEARVEVRTAELKASNEDLESFAYSISHDLRAPLRHINGYSRLLSQRSHQILDENTKEFVGFIADASLKLSKQIEDLLQYSRIGRKEIKIESIDIQSLINHHTKILQRENRNRRIIFNISELPTVQGDSILINQLFYNLLSNAVKYTRKEAGAMVEVGVDSHKTHHIFYVRDNGVGFDPAYSHKLFQVFKRLHGESEFEGTGIGLANVYRIVQRHGGKVWGESKPGEGATFYVQLPIL